MGKNEASERRETVLLVLGCVVVGAWIVVVLIQAAFPTHVVPREVHGIAFLVSSSLFGTAFVVNRRGGNGGS